jgi:hypothetical protein
MKREDFVPRDGADPRRKIGVETELQGLFTHRQKAFLQEIIGGGKVGHERLDEAADLRLVLDEESLHAERVGSLSGGEVGGIHDCVMGIPNP